MESVTREERMIIRNPNILQLYSVATPNGIKVAAALEELVLLKILKGEDFDYEPHSVDIRHGESRTEEFYKLNPNKKIPALLDPHGEDGKEIRVFESGSILLYLATKYVELAPLDSVGRAETVKWLFWGSASFSVQVKEFVKYYKYCPHSLPYCINRYAQEVKVLLHALNKQLSHAKHFVIGGKRTILNSICLNGR
jgi:GST-like protein